MNIGTNIQADSNEPKWKILARERSEKLRCWAYIGENKRELQWMWDWDFRGWIMVMERSMQNLSCKKLS